MARRRRHHRRSNPVRLPTVVKKWLPLPPIAQVASLALGSFAGGFAAPRLFAMLPVLGRNAFTRIAGRLIVFSVASIAAAKVLGNKRSIAESFSLGVLVNQLPHMTNDALSLVNMKLNFGLSDEAEEIGYFYGEEPLMLGDSSAEMGADESAQIGHFWGQPSFVE